MASFLISSLFLLPAFLNLAVSREFDLNLAIDRPNLVTLGEEVSVSCTLAASVNATIVDQKCIFEGDSQVLLLDGATGTVVVSGNVLPLEGYTAVVDDKTCGLTIEAVKDTDLGQWSCVLEGDPEHRGTFLLLEEGFQDDVRIPRHFVPQTYTVQLIPILEVDAFVIEGKVDMILDYTAPADPALSSRIYLHSLETSIDESTIKLMDQSSNTEIEIVGYEWDLERQFFIIEVNDGEFSDGTSYQLSIEFLSDLNDQLVGFYRSSYTVDGETRYLAVTQFEATDARRAFPCLDEPNLKANFTIKLGRKEAMTAASNMPVEGNPVPVDGKDGYVLDTFLETPKMSTYLVVALIADFEQTPSPSNDANPDNTDFSIWHQEGKSNQAELAAEAGPIVLNSFEEYFAVDFPLPKMDMAAIPDFEAGAMENWGLITYRDALLLWDENYSSQTDRAQVLVVISHELSHMWFGDLVTMDWWTDIWLNEGMATYNERLGVDFFDDTLKSVERAIIEDQHDVFQLDALETTTPLSGNVTNPDYNLSFGDITYSKGACIVRMMANFLTLDVFNEGITNYLTGNAYGNADRSSLWEYMNIVGHANGTLPLSLDLETIMEPWATQGGYPVITVASRDGGDVVLEQSRFYLNPEVEGSPAKWFVPITFVSLDDNLTESVDTVWFEDTDPTLTISVGTGAYVINYKEQSYYRVNYDMANWEALVEAMLNTPELIDIQNKAQMYDDSFNLARAGQLDYNIPLTMAEALSIEFDYIPLYAGTEGLSYLDLMLRNDPVTYPYLQEWVKQLLADNYDDIGFEPAGNETYLDLLRRNVVVKWMCLYKLPDCLDKATSLFAQWMASDNPDTDNPILPDQRFNIYKIGVREGGEEEFNFLLDRLGNVANEGETVNLLYGLGSTMDKALVNRLLDMTITTDSPIRSQDRRSVYRSVGSTTVGRTTQFAWLNNNYDAVLEANGPNFPSVVGELLQGFSSDANLPKEVSELQAFLDYHREDLGSAVTTLERDIETARINENWVEANYATILIYLQSHVTLPSSTTESTEGTTTTVPSLSSDRATISHFTVLFAAAAILVAADRL